MHNGMTLDILIHANWVLMRMNARQPEKPKVMIELLPLKVL